MNDGSFVALTSTPLMKPTVSANARVISSASQKPSPKPPASGEFTEQQEQHPRRTEDRADGEVELSADHQQGHADREHPEGRRGVEDRGRRTPADEVVVAGDDREEEVDQDQGDDRAELGSGEQPGRGAAAADALVLRG